MCSGNLVSDVTNFQCEKVVAVQEKIASPRTWFSADRH